jgi:membrane protein implicated in regulation of membrane protease activity
MKIAKIIFYAIIIFLAAIGAFFIFGLVTAVLQYLFFFGVLLMAGILAVKLLRRKSDHPQLDANRPERELEDAVRRLEEIKRKMRPQMDTDRRR